ncbi:hypothetical protein C4D60_Mb07t02680 [Musa balbisiana]|uniref:Uncharacterized protein n=1 Tax=Musa balbisiana TaxID=52838 RepID=A0A4S8JCN8_MUSBA|nr:hypothetical protein C4D60_Mb07t02680 [Musa balbisiana]
MSCCISPAKMLWIIEDDLYAWFCLEDASSNPDAKSAEDLLKMKIMEQESHSRFRAAHEAALQVDGISQAWADAFLYKDEDEQRKKRGKGR